jgi:hypothetical protein
MCRLGQHPIRYGGRARRALLAAVALPLVCTPLVAVADDDDRTRPETEFVVTARRLDEARAAVEPSLGASTYTLSSEAVEGRPGGETISVGQLLLQSPGVAQTSAGQIQIRGVGQQEYRINNVIVPEGVFDIGERLSTRLVEKVEVVTGALPAEYGLQVGGVVNITTKNGVYNQGGQIELYGGDHAMVEPAFEFVASRGGTNLFASGSYMRSDLGLPLPDSNPDPLHDSTHQLEGLAFLDHIIGEQSRASLIVGGSRDFFQLPNPHGEDAATLAAGGPFHRPFVVHGVSHFLSAALNGVERDSTVYAIASYQHATERLTLQYSGYVRYSTLSVAPDVTGELLFKGASISAQNSDLTGGFQLEAQAKLSSAHNFRLGLDGSWTGSDNDLALAVLRVDPAGRQVSDLPVTLPDSVFERRQTLSAFVQDEWRVGGGFTLNPGLRFDHAGGPGGGATLSPRVSLVWTTPMGSRLHGGYARYFVPAPEDEAPLPPIGLLALTTGAPPGGPSTAQPPETDDYFDVGFEQKAGGLTVGVDAYLRNARNMIDYTHIGETQLTRPFAFFDGRARGIELSATYIRGALSAWSNLAVSRTVGRGIVSDQVFTPTQIAMTAGQYVPTNEDQTYTASGGASYRWGELMLSGQLTYGSGLPRTEQFSDPNGATMPSHIQADISATFRTEVVAHLPLDLRLDIINVFDNRYELRDGTNLGGGVAQWNPGRGFVVGLEQSF